MCFLNNNAHCEVERGLIHTPCALVLLLDLQGKAWLHRSFEFLLFVYLAIWWLPDFSEHSSRVVAMAEIPQFLQILHRSKYYVYVTA